MADRAQESADAIADAAEALATLLDAGVAPVSAWAYAGEESAEPSVRRVAAAVAGGVPPADALAQTGAASGDDALRALAAVWSVADTAGASFAPALRNLAAALRDRAETRREVGVALSGPRATARLVAWLPAVGLAMAFALGVDVIGALTGSVIGWSLLIAGVASSVGGHAWTRRMVRRSAPAGEVAGAGLELLAVALSSGLSVAGARALVAREERRLGLEPEPDDGVDRIVRLAERAGAPVVELLMSASRQRRRAARAAGRRAAATLAVRLMLPLGLCVLPSFMLLGVAPVVLAIVSSTVTSL